MKIKYSIGVKTPAGWRQVDVIASVSPISPAMVQVDIVELIDGETPGSRQSRTGAKRQQFDGRYFASAEAGKRKRLSACTIVD
jgi:hypothetical protein